MTDYASSAAEPSWTWWMTTAAAAAMRMRNLRHHHGGGGGSDGVLSDVDDEFAGPDSKRKRVANEDYWTATYDGDHDPTASVGPLDLSVKATLTTAAAAETTKLKIEHRDEHVAKTPVKRSTSGTANSRSSKKSKTGNTASATAAVKAATRKLLPQLLLDQHRAVDRSSPVSGTIIVPATQEDPSSTGSPLHKSPSPSPYTVDGGDHHGKDGDDYDGGDIDPEFNVVVATDEARRRIESIPNALGPYRCRLCSVCYADAFALARHRCRCIVHVRYRCPECDKVFQCPANLASHRRWHGAGTKVSAGGAAANNNNNSSSNNNNNNDNSSNKKIKLETTSSNDDDDRDAVVVAGGPTTAPATLAAVTPTVAGFKKNILQRAVQAAAAAAASDHDTTGVANNTS